MRPGIPLG